MRRINCDVLVIGGGGAGAMAAYEAAKHKVRVAVVSKGRIQRSGCTIMAPGAISGVGDEWAVPGDSKRLHLEDTVRGGAYLNDQNLVSILVEEAPEAILELERIGAIWQRDETGKKYALRIDGGHTYHRTVFLEDRTGREILRSLFGELKKRDVGLYEEIMITRIIHDGCCAGGAAGVDINTLEPVIFESGAVILATGGAGNVYANTDNPTDVTGDGYRLALEAGVPLMDMEFVQFFPIGFLFPPSLRGVLGGLLYYSRLLNAKKERFMEKYDPQRLELSTRDRVSRAMFMEVREGRGTPLGGVYCDMTYQPPGYIAKMTPALYDTYRQIGIDPEKDLLEVAPTCHFFMGGMVINENWETEMTGLLGAGEVCAGIHGGNRLSQNALAEILVSGKRAGKRAAEIAAGTGRKRIDPCEARWEEEKIKRVLKASGQGLRPLAFRQKIKDLMWENVGVFRTKESLEYALEKIQQLQEIEAAVSEKKAAGSQEVVQVLENESILETARCIIHAALDRKESRGAHYRNDYPDTDNKNWLKHITVKKIGKTVQLDYRRVDTRILKPGGFD
ncbi:MAG: FAD-dependent oxidoreductase [Peptococcaceae bacterium]|jgi:succinate dehydrogenase/fumarate reductase flavoprotein subunit|nr:FAD-dependent oxidoreductase [Peptococcaceae bacterium]MDH7523802.1 FAD-dependent oxidoreductase [Peptococcaceae bacterium]